MYNFISLANEFTQLQGDWVQIAPYGDFAHNGHGRGTKYLQRIDRAAANDVKASFDQMRSVKGPQFPGVPWYIGHPDVPEVANEYPDQRAYGWIMDLEARNDGLFGRVKWSETGKTLISNAHFKFYSPYFGLVAAEKVGDRVVARPTQLVSVGFTNTPNIPVSLLANAAEVGGRGYPGETPGNTALRLANDYLRATTCTWDEAWSHIKETRSDLFERMHKPPHLL